MNFKIWLEQNEPKPIQMPFYRITNGIYGTAGKYTEKPLENIIAPGTYWTPRWDSVIMMLNTTLQMYLKSSLKNEDKYWQTTIYKIEKALMQDPPQEHEWAFTHAVDAGEQVLVKALETPEIMIDPESGVKLEKIHPQDEVFSNLVMKIFSVKKLVDLKNTIKASYNNEEVYITWDYKDCSIKLMKKSSNSWESIVYLEIRDFRTWVETQKKLKYDYNDPLVDGLEWFILDMDQQARKGDLKAKNWLQPVFNS